MSLKCFKIKGLEVKMRVRSIFVLLVLLMVLIFVNQTILPAGEDSNTENGGSISGKIIEKDSKDPIANIKLQLTIHIPGKHTRRKETKTDGIGRYRFENLEPAKYRIEIIPIHPYCYRFSNQINNHKVIILKENEDRVCDGILEIGGSVRGFVYKAPGVPFNNVFIKINSDNNSFGFGRTKEDGSFFIGNLCDSEDYYLEFTHKISGHSYKFIDNIQIEKGKSTKIDDIVFDFDDVTGIEGYVKSAIDRKPLANARLSFWYKQQITGGRNLTSGEVNTDENGYFYMKNLKPGKYFIYALWPAEGPKKNPKTGKLLYILGNVEKRNKKLLFVDVEQGQIHKIAISIDLNSKIITEVIEQDERRKK